jgi:UDP-2-acetamido-2,6-beta-L-arabino-hexul-4-ose reductase
VVNSLNQRNEVTKILITGSDGFIGKNLQLLLGERQDLEVRCFTKQNSAADLIHLVKDVNLVFHLAGVNRPQDPADFQTGNVDLTELLANAISHEVDATGRPLSVVLASSIQAEFNNLYGDSKRRAEEIIFNLSVDKSLPAYVFRLPNVFGKWCKPNYNSVVATFCHNIARDLPVHVNDPEALVNLVHIDDLLKQFLQIIDGKQSQQTASKFMQVHPQYQISVGELAQTLKLFKESRDTLTLQGVGQGLQKALYSTYVSYLPSHAFCYDLPQYQDIRGTFVEMLKTSDTGQFSYFTAHPGITRGSHYHHTKTEKFLVIKGRARFGFRNMQSQEIVSLETSGDKPQVVETIPGWTHDITNVGDEEMFVLVWANEIFDRKNPDTYPCLV